MEVIELKPGSIIRSLVAGKSMPGVIPLALLSTDRILQRWAVRTGSGLPSDEWDDRPIARPPPLDDTTMEIIDDIVKHLPPRTRRVVVGWYCRPLPTVTLAEELRMSPTALKTAHSLSLNFLKWKFESAQDKTLLKLLANRG